jgi:hypothetical protein
MNKAKRADKTETLKCTMKLIDEYGAVLDNEKFYKRLGRMQSAQLKLAMDIEKLWIKRYKAPAELKSLRRHEAKLKRELDRTEEIEAKKAKVRRYRQEVARIERELAKAGMGD